MAVAMDQRRAACGDGGIAAGFAEVSDQTGALADLARICSIRKSTRVIEGLAVSREIHWAVSEPFPVGLGLRTLEPSESRCKHRR